MLVQIVPCEFLPDT